MKTLTAAIQFGSSRISAAAVWIDKSGHHEVASIECTSTEGCIRHGCVVNNEETAARIKSLLKKLSNRVKANGAGDIDAAYCGICGMSMQSREHHPSVLLDEDLRIGQEVKSQLEQQSWELQLTGKDILGVCSNGEHISEQLAVSDHQLIVAESRLAQGIRNAMERAKVRVVKILPTPLLVGDILTDEEKANGTLLLDMGAQLTTISIYDKGGLQFLRVLPLGCESVTRDIATMGLRSDDAENVKKNWGDASRPDTGSETMPHLDINLPLSELNIIVSSRLEELAMNIDLQIARANYKGRLSSCVLTGGGSMQKGLTSLLSKQLNISKISTRGCNNIRFMSSERKPHLTSLMSMLSYCTESCEAKPVEKTEGESGALANGTNKSKETAKTDSAQEVNLPNNSEKKGGFVSSFFNDLFAGVD